MSDKENEAFVYRWFDAKTNMIYVGIHKGTPDDGYICSSKYMMEEYIQRPDDFKREILCFDTYENCYMIETEILKNKDETYYNKSSNNFRRVGFNKEEAKQHSKRMKRWHEKNVHPMLGRTHTQEARQKVSEAQKKVPSHVKARGGYKTSELGLSGFKQKVKCEKCGLITNKPGMVMHKRKCKYDRLN